MQKIKLLIRYFQTYKFYGIVLFISVYILEHKTVNLKEFGKILLRPGTTDKDMFTQIFVYQAKDHIVEGDVKTILDLGGNNGMTARFFNYKYPSAIIYAVEPDKENFKALQAQSKGISNIIAINKAIWNENGVVYLDESESWAVKIDMKQGKNAIESITINSLISEYGITQIDLLKIDIEGAEKEVFQSDTSFLEITKNINIELHERIQPGCANIFFKSLNNYSYGYLVNYVNTWITNIHKL
jgi:FkbM family methyltransferase